MRFDANKFIYEEAFIEDNYELFLQMNDIEHTMTKAKSPHTNGICERFHQTVENEFFKIVFRKAIYKSVEQLQEDLDFFMLQ